MYICLNCGEEFEEPRIRIDRYGVHFRSPCCGEEFARAVRCDWCGRVIDAESSAHGLCRECAENVVGRLRRFLLNEFTESERDILNDAFDGVPLTDPKEAKVVIP